LARKDACRLALLGYGEQAQTHARAISKIRKLESTTVWGRSFERAQDFANKMRNEMSVPVSAAGSVPEAVKDADIICTLTSSYDPILKAEWVQPGTHLNVVGSSHAGPAEIDNALVVRSSFFVDSREGVLQQGGEFLRAKAAGLIGDDHIVGEIGQVLAGDVPGRRTMEEITIYKSLGHVVQDLATAWALYSQPEDQ
jgi:ornithine cyclodeaminase